MFDQNFEKLNFREIYPEHYAAWEDEITLTTTHDFNYITTLWSWDPEASKEFNKAVQLLEGLMFTLKFKLKSNPPEGFFDFFMPPSECVRKNLEKKRDTRKRKISLPLPPFLWEEKVIHARRVAQAKTDEKLPQVKFATWKARQVIQILHIWAYGSSKATIKKLHTYAKKNWLEIKGDYQELYLNDMRRTKPDKLETIIRMDVKKAKK